MLRLPRKECDDSLAIWQKWQQTKSENEELTAELMLAIDHIASCPQCFSDISALGFNIFVDPNKDSLFTQFPTFLETEKQKGLLAASLKTPAVTNYLVKNRHIFDRFETFSSSLQGWKNMPLPADVVYTIERKLADTNWVSSFAGHFGITKNGKLKKVAAATLEFNLNIKTMSILVSREMVNAITDSISSQIAVSKNQPSGEEVATRWIDLVTPEIHVNVEINPKRGFIRLHLPTKGRYQNSVPLVALIFEDGIVISKEVSPIHEGREVLFSGLNTGNYLIAINITDRAKVMITPQIDEIANVKKKISKTIDEKHLQPPEKA